MTVTLRKYCTRAASTKTVLASLETDSKGEFTIRDGRVAISVLPKSEKLQAKIVYEALLDRLMLARKAD